MKQTTTLRRAAGAAAVVAIAFAAASASAGKPAGPKCTPQNFTNPNLDLEWVQPGPAGYPACGKFHVKGTITGTYWSCIVNDPAGNFVPDTPWSIFHLGSQSANFNANNYSMYADEWIETPEGILKLHTIVVGFNDLMVQAGLSRVVPGSTGKFANATGVMSGSPDWQFFDPVSGAPFPGTMRTSGYVCTP